MNPFYKIFATITFLLTIPFVILVGIVTIWKRSKPVYPEGYFEAAKKAQKDLHLQ